jgi:hypothetical protein
MVRFLVPLVKGKKYGNFSLSSTEAQLFPLIEQVNEM